jgi:dihydrofolate synthase/folylpolyglutamate synthase
LTDPHRKDESSKGDADYQKAVEFLYNRINYERMVRGTSRYPFRLQRITDLMRRLGLNRYLFQDSPQPKVPVIHIAGTKGKGSTAAMVAATLTASGRKTGLYTSPHLHRLEERFRVDGIPCSDESFVELVDQVSDATLAMEASGEPVSFFELTTAIALMHFDRSACDTIVL